MMGRSRSRFHALLGYEPNDSALFERAAHTGSREFGPLEHLGDTIADLAVGIAAFRSGRSWSDASALTSNDHLDEVFDDVFRGSVRARSGDVVEALIGAVHLDGGFDAAANVAVRLCGDGLIWKRLGHQVLDCLPTDTEGVCPVWLGAFGVEALVADRAVRRMGLERSSQRLLHEDRLIVAANDRLAAAARGTGIACEDASDYSAARALRRSVGLCLLLAGWRRTATLLEPLLQ